MPCCLQTHAATEPGSPAQTLQYNTNFSDRGRPSLLSQDYDCRASATRQLLLGSLSVYEIDRRGRPAVVSNEVSVKIYGKRECPQTFGNFARGSLNQDLQIERDDNVRELFPLG
jgi:hypothetical protein